MPLYMDYGPQEKFASSSVHGANRLGANSLLDIVVFGKACAENTATQNTPQENIEHHDSKILQENIDKYENILHKKGTISVAELRLEMRKITQNMLAFLEIHSH